MHCLVIWFRVFFLCILIWSMWWWLNENCIVKCSLVLIYLIKNTLLQFSDHLISLLCVSDHLISLISVFQIVVVERSVVIHVFLMPNYIHWTWTSSVVISFTTSSVYGLSNTFTELYNFPSNVYQSLEDSATVCPISTWVTWLLKSCSRYSIVVLRMLRLLH